ncbi:MAG TPA: SLBB domain-containing protein [Pyrinomonadaceae bacterium]|jgi:protein involved in polysaccharide export with SLBB domain
MKYRKLFQIFFIFVCLPLTRSFLAAQTHGNKASLQTNPPSAENLIHQGDLIDVDILGSFEYDWRGKLTPEGYIDGLSFIEEPVFGLCRSEEDVARDIVRGYEKLLRNPKVVVKILDRSNRATAVLVGAVKKPQRFQIKRSVFLNELLIVSGGLTELADGEIRIFRPQNLSCLAEPKVFESAISDNGEKRERFVKTRQGNVATTLSVKISDLLNGNKESNPQILSGDIVTVLEAAPIYITGGVNSPKQIAARSKLTVSRAVDSAGGLTKNATEDSITIFRRVGRETKVIEVDLKKIKAEQAEDIVLQSFDIVEVGEKGRAKKKFPPVIQLQSTTESQSAALPFRIIE